MTDHHLVASRRGFLLGLGAAFAAPAIVRAESLMKLWVPPAPKLVVPADYAGHLFTDAGQIVGWWTQTAGKIAFNYRNPDQVAPKNGVWQQSGSGFQFSKMAEIIDIIGDVKPYPPAGFSP